MRPRILDVLNTAFHTDVFSYLVPVGAFMYFLAMIVGMWVFTRRSKITGLSTYHALGACIFAMVGGLIGARLFYLVQHLRHTVAHPEVIFDLGGGTVSWGAYLGGFAGFFFYLKRKKMPVLSYADVLGSTLGLGPFIGRWSCFLNGCCYGKLSTLPWAVQFPANSFPYMAHMRAGLIKSNANLSLSVHPVQLYLSLSGLIIFIIASRFWYRFKNKEGTTFAFYWMLYGSFRFMIEFFRADSERMSVLHLTLAQYICIFVFLISLLFFFSRMFAFPVEKRLVN